MRLPEPITLPPANVTQALAEAESVLEQLALIERSRQELLGQLSDLQDAVRPWADEKPFGPNVKGQVGNLKIDFGMTKESLGGFEDFKDVEAAAQNLRGDNRTVISTCYDEPKLNRNKLRHLATTHPKLFKSLGLEVVPGEQKCKLDLINE